MKQAIPLIALSLLLGCAGGDPYDVEPFAEHLEEIETGTARQALAVANISPMHGACVKDANNSNTVNYNEPHVGTCHLPQGGPIRVRVTLTPFTTPGSTGEWYMARANTALANAAADIAGTLGFSTSLQFVTSGEDVQLEFLEGTPPGLLGDLNGGFNCMAWSDQITPAPNGARRMCERGRVRIFLTNIYNSLPRGWGIPDCWHGTTPNRIFELAVRHTLVHEFGHYLGFGHGPWGSLQARSMADGGQPVWTAAYDSIGSPIPAGPNCGAAPLFRFWRDKAVETGAPFTFTTSERDRVSLFLSNPGLPD